MLSFGLFCDWVGKLHQQGCLAREGQRRTQNGNTVHRIGNEKASEASKDEGRSGATLGNSSIGRVRREAPSSNLKLLIYASTAPQNRGHDIFCQSTPLRLIEGHPCCILTKAFVRGPSDVPLALWSDHRSRYLVCRLPCPRKVFESLSSWHIQGHIRYGVVVLKDQKGKTYCHVV